MMLMRVKNHRSVICGWFIILALVLMWSVLTVSSEYDKCMNVCSCKWKNGKRTVVCKKNKLNGVPDGIDPETQVLDVSENNIATLTNRIFIIVRLTNLQRLYMRSCHISRIDKDALAGLTNLVELDLSHNKLKAVPSASFSEAPFLRDLVLAYNPLVKIEPNAFKDTPNLVKLDLSNTSLEEISAKGFHGLDMLESLKLNHNKLVTFEQGTFDLLTKLTSIELHDNPWICDCQLREMKSWLVKQNLPTPIAPTCHQPERHVNKSFSDLTSDEFACRPILFVGNRYAEATIGENATIVCSVTAIPPAKIKWIWNGKLYTNNTVVNSYQKILIHEEGQFRKYSTIVLTNAQETDSTNFFCIAENPAGSVETNFTLHVSLRTAGMSTLGSGQIAGISAALVVLILLILLTIMVLFVRLKRMPQKDTVKTPAPGSDNLPLDGCNSSSTNHQDPNNPQSASSTISRRKATDEIETTSFTEVKQHQQQQQHQHQQQQQQLSGLTSGNTLLVNHHQHNYQISRPTVGVTNNLMTSDNYHFHHQNYPHDYVINHGYEEGSITNIITSSQQQVPPMIIGQLKDSCAYSSQASLMPIDNPDLIRDTRLGTNDDGVGLPIPNYASTGEYSRIMDNVDDGKFIYSECLSWEAQQSRAEVICRPSISTNHPYPAAPSKDIAQASNVLMPGQHHLQQQQQQQQQHQQPQQRLEAQEVAFPPGAKQIRVWQKGVPVLPPVSSALKRVLGSTRSSPDEGYQEGTGTDV